MKREEILALLNLCDESDAGSVAAVPHPFEVGKAYLWRTVTYHMVGRVVRTVGKFIVLDDAAWIADSGRFADAIKTGTANEIEPVGRCYLNVESVTDAEEWRGTLPLPQK